MRCLVTPTRNNPAALAGMLSSYLACTHWRYDLKPLLILADGSDLPVMCDKHISRLLSHFELHYSHFLKPGLGVQRVWALELAASLGISRVLMADDDHVFLRVGQADPDMPKIVFGKCADLLNDKGYQDFKPTGPLQGHHSLTAPPGVPRYALCESLSWSANGGLCLLDPRLGDKLASILTSVQSNAVADDAWAAICAEASGHFLDTHTQAYHIGNSNNNWNSGAIKQEAVRLAVASQPGMTP